MSTNPQQAVQSAQTMTPEAIDAAIIQLESLLETMPGIPRSVTESGKEFVSALGTWSGDLKNMRSLQRAEGQTAKSI